jgi:hypothetical protein
LKHLPGVIGLIAIAAEMLMPALERAPADLPHATPPRDIIIADRLFQGHNSHTSIPIRT